MAQRCPGSVFKGPATLDSFRWHINERGVANVLESDGNHSVEGLLYLINPKDEGVLDRNEGVSRGFYQKHLTMVSFQPHGQYSDVKTTRLALLLKQRRDEIDDDISSNRTSRRSPWYKAKALVYVSNDYNRDGPIREEYITRMEGAVNDAVLLGVSKPFVNNYIVPFLNPERVFHLSSSEHKQREKGLVGRGPEPSAPDTAVRRSKSTENRIKPDADSNGAAAHYLTMKKNGSERLDAPHVNAENQARSEDCLCIYPSDMLEAVDNVRRSTREWCEYYVVVERRTGVDTSVSVAVSTGQPRLANEAAMKEFKKVLNTEGKSAVVSFEAPDVVVVEEGSPV
ncbi:hypothetical protein ACLX1H_004605 [Fusarium chlamydosporum]